MQRILVTGAAGFIGRHLVGELVAAGHAVQVTDRHGTDLERDDGAGVCFADLTLPGDAAKTVQVFAPNVVVHLAAQVGRLFGEDDRQQSVMANALATTQLAAAVGAQADCRMVYASTSEVYGDQGVHSCHESDQLLLPHNLYGLTKRWGEEACRLYCPDGLQVLRLSMPYGTGVAPGRGRAALPNVLWQAVTGQRIPIHNGSERSWCWVGDTVAGIRMVIERGDRVHHLDCAGGWCGCGSGVYNIGRDDDPVSMLSLAHTACEMVGADRSLVDVIDAPNAQTVVKRLSTERLRSLGWQPKVELEQGMAEVLSWVRQFDREGNQTKVLA